MKLDNTVLRSGLPAYCNCRSVLGYSVDGCEVPEIVYRGRKYKWGEDPRPDDFRKVERILRVLNSACRLSILIAERGPCPSSKRRYRRRVVVGGRWMDLRSCTAISEKNNTMKTKKGLRMSRNIVRPMDQHLKGASGDQMSHKTSGDPFRNLSPVT
jgi:hypothetical protein